MEVCMSDSVVQIRIDDSLKQKVSKIYENLGLDLTTATRMFYTRSIQVGGLPFSVSCETSYDYDSAIKNIIQARYDSVKNGTSDILLEEINAEISAYRNEN